ncbi:arginase family protein [Sphingobium terrigena]|uniref:Arginase family protein n=1 Tax=Sphingobium terrigena TaxID=2304063 RepID=A0A418YUQ5_9SPHN|nr:arginase family protein [Sphingobium terrigena]RJG55894.1 arginase family protein [Sphingobium terrigena]
MDVMIYAANAGDRNERGMLGALSLGAEIAHRLDAEARTIGSPVAIVEGGWVDQLKAATPTLRLLARRVAEQLGDSGSFILTMGRCAAGIATLPPVASRYPDAAIVWFDAHGDCNVPTEDGAMRYLGGMVISGAAGEWDTGFGHGVDLANVILVGARDLDPPELERIDAGQIGLVPVGPDLGRRLARAIRGRRVYVHLDCDVLDAGLLATEYQSPNGLSYADLREAFEILAEHDVLGLEIAEYEASWPDGRPNPPDRLIDAISPVAEAIRSRWNS